MIKVAQIGWHLSNMSADGRQYKFALQACYIFVCVVASCLTRTLKGQS